MRGVGGVLVLGLWTPLRGLGLGSRFVAFLQISQTLKADCCRCSRRRLFAQWRSTLVWRPRSLVGRVPAVQQSLKAPCINVLPRAPSRIYTP